jgi:cytochrome c-type biogenesis protein CcmH
VASNAATIEAPLSNAAQEQSARVLFSELRCVVCEGQSVADSDAVLAAQMRSQVRKLVSEGKSRDEVLAHFRERYGDAILMTPPVQPRTWLLWFAPLLILGGGAVLVRRATTNTSEDS